LVVKNFFVYLGKLKNKNKGYGKRNGYQNY
jgi:hypothetical protein